MEKLLLFIHGLGGHPCGTWRNFATLVAADSELSAFFDVCYYSYPSSLWPFRRGPKIQRLADGLRTEIDNKYARYPSIFLICHSLGGLVAKRYLADRLRDKDALRISGAVLFATPSNGSELAKISRVVPWFSWQHRQLCSDSDFIEALGEDWRRVRAEDRLRVKYVLGGMDAVVSTGSAVGSSGYRDIDCVIDANHRTVVKPVDRDSLAFVIVKRFCTESPKELTPGDEIQQALRRHAERQILAQKRAGKYIPSIFVDRANLRDKFRHFAMPELFLQKAAAHIRRLDFGLVRRFLEDYPLEMISFDLPPDLGARGADESVESHCTRLQAWLREKEEALSRLKSHDISSERTNEQIPVQHRYTWEYRKYSHGYAYQHLSKIWNALAELELVKARGAIITSAAGRGKTNFVCDLVEHVLLPRSVPTLFLTVAELNSVHPNEIWQYVATNILHNRQYEDIDGFFRDSDQLFLRDGQPLIIIVDGLSEHHQLQPFVNHLTLLTQQFLTQANVKFIYTCRSEYFDSRFHAFESALAPYDIVKVREFERNVTSAEQTRLLGAYFEHYRLDCEINESAAERLAQDPLFLRVFCETYGDPASREPTKRRPIYDIYKEDVFRDFLQKKEDAILARVRGSDATPRGRLHHLLGVVTQFMVSTHTFRDIPIGKLSLSGDESNQLQRIVDEGLLLRKDLAAAGGTSPFDTNTEVLNFTMDEFRDYLLASYLIDITLTASLSDFESSVDSIVQPGSSVAEGVRRFLFRMDRSRRLRHLSDVLEARPWYDEVFLEEIFRIPDSHVRADDIARIKLLFKTSVANARDVFLGLLNRIDEELYPRLNASLLLDLCASLSDAQYAVLAAPVFVASQSYFAGPTIIIDSYLTGLLEQVSNSVGDLPAKLHCAIRSLVCCLGAEDDEVYFRTHDLLCEYTFRYPEEAERLLVLCLEKLVCTMLREQLLLIVENVHSRNRKLSPDFYLNLARLITERDRRSMGLPGARGLLDELTNRPRLTP